MPHVDLFHVLTSILLLIRPTTAFPVISHLQHILTSPTISIASLKYAEEHNNATTSPTPIRREGVITMRSTSNHTVSISFSLCTGADPDSSFTTLKHTADDSSPYGDLISSLGDTLNSVMPNPDVIGNTEILAIATEKIPRAGLLTAQIPIHSYGKGSRLHATGLWNRETRIRTREFGTALVKLRLTSATEILRWEQDNECDAEQFSKEGARGVSQVAMEERVIERGVYAGIVKLLLRTTDALVKEGGMERGGTVIERGMFEGVRFDSQWSFGREVESEGDRDGGLMRRFGLGWM